MERRGHAAHRRDADALAQVVVERVEQCGLGERRQQRACLSVRSRSACATAPDACTPASVRPANTTVGNVARHELRHRLLEVALHRALPTALPLRVTRAVVVGRELVAHGTRQLYLVRRASERRASGCAAGVCATSEHVRRASELCAGASDVRRASYVRRRSPRCSLTHTNAELGCGNQRKVERRDRAETVVKQQLTTVAASTDTTISPDTPRAESQQVKSERERMIPTRV